jgi:arsenite methyltransferase
LSGRAKAAKGAAIMEKPDYGLDAPGLCRGFLIFGSLITAIAIIGRWVAVPGFVRWLLPTGTLLGPWLLGLGLLMLYWSRVKKIRDREPMLDRLALPPDGRLLDVGCGRGLLLIGGALRLPQGRATGIDIWSNVDQGANSPAATRENARRVGVLDRVEILTGDMRALPFDDARFDAVCSHWVVHNLAKVADRVTTIDEMIRVLKPGGRLLIADIAHRRAYRDQLAARGMTAITVMALPLRDIVMAALTFGSFVPGAVLARKPG